MEYTTKILIADENPANRLSLREGLLRAGYRSIEEAANGEEALMKVSRMHPDVVLMDVWLSKLDGIGVLRNARNTDWGDEKMPSFIVISSVANNNMFMRATEAGAELCMLKPVNMQSLCEHIQTIVSQRKAEIPAIAMQMAPVEQKPDIEAQVTQIIHQIGVPAHIKGRKNR